MCLASLLSKISKEEAFEDEDWNDVVSLAFCAAIWLYENSRIEKTPTSQVYLQPKSLKKKKLKRRND